MLSNLSHFEDHDQAGVLAFIILVHMHADVRALRRQLCCVPILIRVEYTNGANERCSESMACTATFRYDWELMLTAAAMRGPKVGADTIYHISYLDRTNDTENSSY